MTHPAPTSIDHTIARNSVLSPKGPQQVARVRRAAPTPPSGLSSERREWSTRPARTVHEDIRDRRTASAVRSLRNLIAITTDEIARIDAGTYPAMFATPAHRAALVAELSDYRCKLGEIAPVTLAE